MRRRTAALVALGVGLGLAACTAWWGRGSTPTPTSAAPTSARATATAEPSAAQRRPPADGVGAAIGAAQTEAQTDAQTEAATAFTGRAAEVAARCDLPIRTRCDGDACAGLLVAPDLDRLWGWARLVWTSPRFVATTAGRELGVPLAGMPCSGAVEELVSAPNAHGVLAIEHPDGTEVWCAVSGDPARALALCDAGMAELAPPPTGTTASFARRGVRELSLRR